MTDPASTATPEAVKKIGDLIAAREAIAKQVEELKQRAAGDLTRLTALVADIAKAKAVNVDAVVKWHNEMKTTEELRGKQTAALSKLEQAVTREYNRLRQEQTASAAGALEGVLASLTDQKKKLDADAAALGARIRELQQDLKKREGRRGGPVKKGVKK